MTVTKTFQGAIQIASIVNGHLETKQYIGYTKREAINQFKQEFSKIDKLD